MLILASTSDKLQLNTGSAGSILVHASWMDNIAGAIAPGRTNTPEIATATTTDIVPSPAASVVRAIKTLIIHNHGTANQVVGVMHTDGTTAVQLYAGQLGPQETLQYIDEVGFRQVASSGAVKVPGARDFLRKYTTSTAIPNFTIGPEVFGNTSYDYWEFDFALMSSITDGSPVIRFSVDGGVTYRSGATDYQYTQTFITALNNSGTFAGGQQTFLPLAVFSELNLATAGRFRIWPAVPGLSGFVRVEGVGTGYNSGVGHTGYWVNGGLYGVAGLHTHAQITMFPPSNIMPLSYINAFGYKGG